MKTLKKLSAFLLTLMLCVGVVSMPVMAANDSIERDGLRITLTTDKEEYSEGEEIKLTLKVENTNKEAVTDIELASFISDGYELTEESIQALKELVKLEAGDTESVPITVVKKSTGSSRGSNNNTVTSILKSPDTADNNNIALWVTVFLAGVALIGGAYAIKNKKAKQVLSIMLCVAMVASTFVTTSMPVSAEVQDRTINLSKTVKYAGKDVTFEASFSYKFEDGYKLVWADEFDGTELNRDDWNVELHESGWVNEELQEYVDSSENITVKDGKLIITPIQTKNEDGTYSYTSGRISTQNKQTFKYGKFEARVKVPTGKGYLPAFWLMANDENLYGQWPRCGEIDIMEVHGSDTDTSYGTIHYGSRDTHKQSQSTYTLSEGTFADEFHTFTCEWEPGEIKWYVDGNLFYTENDWYSATEGQGELTYPAPFDQPFYVILNLAVGGSWVGYPDDATFVSDTYEVDYVRVYQKDSYDENVTKPEKEEVVLRDPDANGNYIINGDFATAEDLTDDAAWKFLTALGGEAAAAITNEEMVINSTNAGTVDYSVQLVQANLPMKEGATYTLTFDAYADEARTVIVGVSAPDRSYKRYLNDTKINLTTEKQSFNYNFTMNDSDDANGRLEFNLGNQGSVAGVHIDNVKLVQTSYTAPSDNKTVLSDGNHVYNGQFQEGENRLGDWTVANNCGANVSVTALEDGRRLQVVIPESAGADATVTVSQEDLALIAGADYEISYDAVGNVIVTVEGVAYASGSKFAANSNADDNNIVLTFKGPGTYYIDNVRIDEDKLIKNGSFNAGFVGFDPFVDSGIASDVTYVVDSITEDNAADFTINNTGDQDWKIQLKQSNVELEKDQWYRLSLKMKSSIARDVSVAIQRNGAVHKDANDKEDWLPYLQKTETLGTAYTTFTYDFQMTEATDLGSIFNVSMGAVGGKQITQQHRVCIDDIMLEKIPEPEIDVETGSNLLINANFESGVLEPWEDSSYGGEYEKTVKDNSVIYKITDVGDADSEIQLKQAGLQLENGAKYKATLKATSTEARTIKVGVMNNTNYTWYGGADVVLEKDTPKDISFEFTMSADDIDGALYVSMGKIAGVDTPASTITLSDFTLVKLDETPEVTVEPMPANVNLLKNADFAKGISDSWTAGTWGTGASTSSVSGNSAIFDITNVGAEDSQVSLKQKGITLEKGETYIVSFKATSTESRTIKCALMNEEADYAWYGGADIPLNAGETANVEFGFTVDKASYDNIVFQISMGLISGKDTPASKITLSDLSLIKVDENTGSSDTGSGDTGSEDAGTGDTGTEDTGTGDAGSEDDGTTDEETFDGGLITNGDFSNGGTGWAMHIQSDVAADPAAGVEEVDGAAGTYDVVDGKAVFTITDVGSQDWHVHLNQSGLSMEVGATYNVSFKIKSDVNRTVKYVLQNPDNYKLSYTGNDNNIISLNANEDTLIDYEMQLVATAENPLVNSDKIQFQISMGKVGDNPQPGTITIDDVSIVKVSGPSDTEDDGTTGEETFDGGLITNGDFSDGFNGWDENAYNLYGEATGKLTVSDGNAVFDIDNPGKAEWSIQFKQRELNLEAGSTYNIAFDVTSTESRTVKYGFLTSEDVWCCGGEIYLTANEKKPVSGDITIPADKEDVSVLFFSIGKIETADPHVITIDNVSVTKK